MRDGVVVRGKLIKSNETMTEKRKVGHRPTSK